MPPRIVFLGNSLTAGRHRAAYLPRVRSILADQLGENAPDCTNAGIGGDTIVNLQRRTPWVLQTFKPDRIVVQGGLNDVITAWLPTQPGPKAAQVLDTYFRRTKHALLPMNPDLFRRGVMDLIRELRRERQLPISFCSLTVMGEDLAQDCSLLAAEYDLVLREATASGGCDIIDVRAAFLAALAGLPPRPFDLHEVDFEGLPDDDAADALARRRGYRLVYDGLHLATRGADLMARCVADHLVATGACA